jgi:UDP-N-acetyl-D-glucosamine dehydrogenase
MPFTIVDRFIQKIFQKEVSVGVIGMGYVGLPLVLRFCEKGFRFAGLMPLYYYQANS